MWLLLLLLLQRRYIKCMDLYPFKQYNHHSSCNPNPNRNPKVTWAGSPPKSNQFLLATPSAIQKISPKFNNFLSYPANRQTESVYYLLLPCTIIVIHCYYTARYLAAAQCIVIGPVCGFVCLQRAGGRCPNLTTASARTVCVCLSAFCI